MATRTTYHSGGYQAAAPQKNRSQEFDGTAGTYTAWDASGVQTASRALTAQEAADLAATDASNTADQNGGALRTRAQNALTANTAFLALASPTNAQVVTQVQTLTKECNALIRLVLGQLDSTSGT